MTNFKSPRQRKCVMAKLSKDVVKTRTIDDIFAGYTGSMTVSEAKDYLGDRPRWELLNMKRALTSMPLLNTDDDNKRLKAVTIMLMQGRQVSPTTNKTAIIKMKPLHNLTIESTYIPRGRGNNPYAGKQDLHYKIKEWGFVFTTKADAEKYANEHIEKNGIIIKR